jgi:glyoxylase-like metal-dependent hydrolase (beta-lactamase superfamily II)
MTAIRISGPINPTTSLIDFGLFGIAGIGAVYLIRDRMDVLIDAGTRKEAPKLVKKLKKLGAFPPDIVILTHAHCNHTQGIPLLREEAAKMKKSFDLLASPKTISLLADQTYNKDFKGGPYRSILDVIPIKPGEKLTVGGTTLRIHALPGHTDDHIGVLDETQHNFFVGDALGSKIADGLFLPPFKPPTWDPYAFQKTIKYLAEIEYDSLCLAHFGIIKGEEARTILAEAVVNCQKWWDLFEENESRLDDTGYMAEMVKREFKLVLPPIRVLSSKDKALFGLASSIRRLTHKYPVDLGDRLLGEFVTHLAAGYRVYKLDQICDSS